EWRVRSENKPLMRMAALGTAAVGLMVVIVLMAGSLVVSFTMGVVPVARMARPFTVEQVTTGDSAMRRIGQAIAKKDWEAMKEQAEKASSALSKLSIGPAIPSLTERYVPPTIEELRAQWKAATESFHEVRQAIHYENAGRLKEAMAKFRE